MSSEEPLNVRVARVLGWTMLDPRGEAGWEGEPPPGHPLNRIPRRFDQHCGVPDFASDPAFVLGMIEANRDKNFMIDAFHDGAQHGVHYTIESLRPRRTLGTSKTSLGLALCAWIIAADEAGIEVRRP